MMRWHDQTEHPEPLTECLCEYTSPEDASKWYGFMSAYPEGMWLTGSAIAYAQHEVTRWCPVAEIISALNSNSDDADDPHDRYGVAQDQACGGFTRHERERSN